MSDKIGLGGERACSSIDYEEQKVLADVRLGSTLNEKSYSEVFKDNFSGRSPEAKELKDALKKRESGRTTVSYIPWAVMIRMATIQDPNFVFEKLRSHDGSFLFYNGRPDQDDACYFVKVKATFMGKTVIEEYPIQDFNFEPVNFTGRTMTLASGRSKLIKMDCNIINKSLQRAMAKAISEVTGLGLSLYEDGDLQFEEDTPPSTAKPDKMPKAIKDADIDLPKKPVEEMISDDDIKKLQALENDEALAIRLKKAMAAYKVKSLNEFTAKQAARVLAILTGEIKK